MILRPMTVCSPGLSAKRDDRDNSKSSVRLALAVAAAPGAKLYATPERSSILDVEDVAFRQADIGDFLFAKSNLVAHRGIPGRCMRGRSTTCCRYCGHERQRQSSGPQKRHRFAIALSRRRLLWVRHGESPMNERAFPRICVTRSCHSRFSTRNLAAGSQAVV